MIGGGARLRHPPKGGASGPTLLSAKLLYTSSCNFSQILKTTHQKNRPPSQLSSKFQAVESYDEESCEHGKVKRVDELLDESAEICPRAIKN